MNDLPYDILVVGAGPAGAVSAAEAARRGRRVALLERKQEVGIPVRCGEGVGLKGFALTMPIRSEWILAAIRRVRLVSPSGMELTLADVDTSYVLDRTRMDPDLVKDAQVCGVDYYPATPVVSLQKNADGYVCRSPGKSFYADCVILADGVESRLARQAGWKTALPLRDIETCAFARVEHASIGGDVLAMYTGKKVAPGGYAWIFPRGEGVANVGLGILGSASTGGMARRLLTSFVATHFAGARISHLHCGAVPVGRWLKPLVRGGVMVVGDAARQVNALNGGGINYALFAGQCAGAAAAEAFASGRFNPQALQAYETQWSRRCGKQQMRSYALKQMVVTWPDSVLDDFARRLAGAGAQRLSYLKVFLRVFAAHPRLLLKAFLLFR
ncbi:MAG: geranylgeranyl reductase family protein [Chitinivibrionales bacterium]|nr:geranylgeranyl reductase family protein [Chitinivibrionales bacterium]